MKFNEDILLQSGHESVTGRLTERVQVETLILEDGGQVFCATHCHVMGNHAKLL